MPRPVDLVRAEPHRGIGVQPRGRGVPRAARTTRADPRVPVEYAPSVYASAPLSMSPRARCMHDAALGQRTRRPSRASAYGPKWRSGGREEEHFHHAHRRASPLEQRPGRSRTGITSASTSTSSRGTRVLTTAPYDSAPKNNDATITPVGWLRPSSATAMPMKPAPPRSPARSSVCSRARSCCAEAEERAQSAIASSCVPPIETPPYSAARSRSGPPRAARSRAAGGKQQRQREREREPEQQRHVDRRAAQRQERVEPRQPVRQADVARYGRGEHRAARPRDERERDEVEHDRVDHLVRAETRLERARIAPHAAPARPAASTAATPAAAPAAAGNAPRARRRTRP